MPDLHIDPMNPPPAAFAPLSAWVSASHAGGALVASVCSGALLIAATGLLDHCEATTHWGYADLLARLHPEVKVRRERILVPSGEGHRIITTGGASAWADLLL